MEIKKKKSYTANQKVPTSECKVSREDQFRENRYFTLESVLSSVMSTWF